MKDIANELGLSVSTVSRSLRDLGEISEETRIRVKDLAEKWQYRPNILARNLLNRSSKTIGILLPDIEDYFYANVLKGLDEKLRANGYSVLVSYTNDVGDSERQMIDEFYKYSVDGIIASPSYSSLSHNHYYSLKEEKIPLTLVNRDISNLNVPKILTDNVKACMEVVGHLYDKGRERIAMVTNLESVSEGKMQHEGYLQSLKEYRLPFFKELLVHSNLGISTAMGATKYLMELEKPPDAIIYGNNIAAMASYQVIKRFGKNIPKDISIVGLSDSPYSSFMEPPLTAMSLPGYMTGIRAADITIELIENPGITEENFELLLKPSLVIRKSS